MGDVLKLFEQLEDHSSLKAVDPDQFPTDMEHSIEKANEYAAPEPTDVNWNFLETSPYQQKVRNIISNAITFFLLLISFIIIMLLLRIQQSGSTTTIVLDKKGKQQAVTMTASDWTVKALALIISLVIPMLNYILQLCLTKLSIFERHHRKTNEIASLGQKLAWTQFINTAIITFTIKVLFDFFTDRQQAEDNIYMAGGLIYNQQYVFITNSLIAAASIAVDGGRLYKIINRNYLAKKNTMTQRQLNTLYEEPEHNLAFDYSGLMKTMLFTAFYAPLIPLGIILSIVGIAVLYFIQKYKIMNHRTIRYSMSNQISLEMIELMEYILPVYCLANMIYEYIMVREAQVSWFSLLGITLGILNIALPMDSFNEALFYVKSCPDLTEKYEDNIHNFQFDYDRANPATDDYARKLYIEQEVKGVNTYGLNNPGTLFAKF